MPRAVSRIASAAPVLDDGGDDDRRTSGGGGVRAMVHRDPSNVCLRAANAATPSGSDLQVSHLAVSCHCTSFSWSASD